MTNINMSLFRLFTSIESLKNNDMSRTDFIKSVKENYLTNSITKLRVYDELIVLSAYMIYFANNEKPINNSIEAIAVASNIMNSNAEDKFAAIFILSFVPSSNSLIRRIVRTNKHNSLFPLIALEYYIEE
jgi:hypothetical protein